MESKNNSEISELKKSKNSQGVPDGDGGSIEREDALKRNNDRIEKVEDNEDENPLEDEGDWANNPNELPSSNSINSDSETRNGESIEGAMNNPGVRTSTRFNSKDYGVVFLDSEIRAIGCGAWYSVKGE